MSSVIQGTKFDYRIDEGFGLKQGFIAKGTESIVFKGIKYGNGLNYSCALKFKPIARLKDFMQREYKIVESMQICRSVVRILDVIEDLKDFRVSMPEDGININGKNYFCVVEEYIDGDSLQDYCIKHWYRYDEETRQWERNKTAYNYRETVKFQNQLLQFMVNLCEIMQFVSNVNRNNMKTDYDKPRVLHCDIKPENIMVTKHGKELVLIDFGRSRQLDDRQTFKFVNNYDEGTFEADFSDVQIHDGVKENFYAYGTVGYSAPECYAKASCGLSPFTDQYPVMECGNISIESDIFGFGTTFYECFSIFETCDAIFRENEDHSDPRLFNKKILRNAELLVKNSITDEYCDRDFRGISDAYHERIEAIIKKCTTTRYAGFQDPDDESGGCYHNFFELKDDIELARDIIPPLDRKSDPLVRQMLGISGFCTVFSIFFFILWILLFSFANVMALDRWENLKMYYTLNQVSDLRSVSEDMLEVPFGSVREKNMDMIVEFTYGGGQNDTVVDSRECEILIDLMRNRIKDKDKWSGYVDEMIKHAKSDDLDYIAEQVYLLNITDRSCTGYKLAKALAELNDADDRQADVIAPIYDIMVSFRDDSDYSTIVSKLALKFLMGRKIDTLADHLGTTREEIQNVILDISKQGGA